MADGPPTEAGPNTVGSRTGDAYSPAATPTGNDTGERATTLILVPTMMIVFIALAGIAVDLSMMHMVKRRAVNVVSVAASDAAGMIDDRALQNDGELRMDTLRAERVLIAHIGTQDLAGTVTDGPNVSFSPDGLVISVSLRLRVEHIFLRAIPSLREDEFTIRGSARLTTSGP